jgi:hypothetical protein
VESGVADQSPPTLLQFLVYRQTTFAPFESLLRRGMFWRNLLGSGPGVGPGVEPDVMRRGQAASRKSPAAVVPISKT